MPRSKQSVTHGLDGASLFSFVRNVLQCSDTHLFWLRTVKKMLISHLTTRWFLEFLEFACSGQ